MQKYFGLKAVRSILMYENNQLPKHLFFSLPDDIWLIDLDSNKLSPPTGTHEEIPPLPEPEGTILKNHLKQVKAMNRHFCTNMRFYFFGLLFS